MTTGHVFFVFQGLKRRKVDWGSPQRQNFTPLSRCFCLCSCQLTVDLLALAGLVLKCQPQSSILSDGAGLEIIACLVWYQPVVLNLRKILLLKKAPTICERRCVSPTLPQRPLQMKPSLPKRSWELPC